VKLTLEWLEPVRLRLEDNGVIYTCPKLGEIPTLPGIYIFGRLYGQKFEAFYVGRATTLRGRINTQLNNARLMAHIKQAPKGYRVVYPAVFKPRPNQIPATCLPIIELAHIRHFLLEGHDLVNDHGTRPPLQHEIVGLGKNIPLPHLMRVDR
jgi:hypothetical protein